MMNPELRKRFVGSIEYLRKMDFFKDYSNLSSEEILERIFRGEIDYGVDWFVEEWPEEKWRKERTHGQILKEWIEKSKEHEEYWMKASDFKVDLEMASFDIKRIFIEDPEAVIREGICKMLLKKLSRISRGVFNPRYIKEEILEWDEEPPPALKEEFGDQYSRYGGFVFKVYFEFREREHLVEFYSIRDYLHMNPAMKRINELIKDTGYQYYRLHDDIEDITFVVFSNDEVEKLKERGWRLSLP
ncbi:MAG: hypothetical protein QXF52_09390 [Thermoproteota archaeon]